MFSEQTSHIPTNYTRTSHGEDSFGDKIGAGKTSEHDLKGVHQSSPSILEHMFKQNGNLQGTGTSFHSLKVHKGSRSIDQHAASIENMSKESCRKVLDAWLAEYKGLSEVALKDYAARIKKDNQPLLAFEHAVFGMDNSVLAKYVTPACHQLFNFFRSEHKELRIYAMGFFPALIGGYFHNHLPMDAPCEYSSSISTVILSIYGLLCNDSNDKASMNLSGPNTATTVPNMSKSSLYHNATLYPFTENMLNPSKTQSALIRVRTAENYSKITAHNRAKIFGMLLTTYFDWVAEIQNCSLALLCRICHYLATRGFPWQKLYLCGRSYQNVRRIKLEPDIILPMLQSLHFALYNDQHRSAKDAVEAMLILAKLKLEPKVITMCQAVLSTVQHEERQYSEPFLSISSKITPRLSRANSTLRTAATAQSIRLHKWHHQNEDVSADYMPVRDLTQSTVVHVHKTQSQPNAFGGPSRSKTEQRSVDDSLDNLHSFASKEEKSPITPKKSIKTKFKNIPHPSLNMLPSLSKTKTSSGEKLRRRDFDLQQIFSASGVDISIETKKTKGKKSISDLESKKSDSSTSISIIQGGGVIYESSDVDQHSSAHNSDNDDITSRASHRSGREEISVRINGSEQMTVITMTTDTAASSSTSSPKRPNSIRIRNNNGKCSIPNSDGSDDVGGEHDALLFNPETALVASSAIGIRDIEIRTTTTAPRSQSSYDVVGSKQLLFADDSNDDEMKNCERKSETTVL